ncbi:Uncharacterised protein [Bordetella pertussis]|nr:Uncharacterised protein [Bordetella pertussis]
MENRPGAATLLGLRAVVRDQPDGYTMALRVAISRPPWPNSSPG